MRPVGWFVLLPAVLVAGAVAVANRQPVVLSLDPLPWSLEVPLYAVLFGGILIGLLTGLLAEWWIARRWRREARLRRREARVLAAENQRLQSRPAGSAGPSSLGATSS